MLMNIVNPYTVEYNIELHANHTHVDLVDGVLQINLNKDAVTSVNDINRELTVTVLNKPPRFNSVPYTSDVLNAVAGEANTFSIRHYQEGTINVNAAQLDSFKDTLYYELFAVGSLGDRLETLLLDTFIDLRDNETHVVGADTIFATDFVTELSSFINNVEDMYEGWLRIDSSTGVITIDPEGFPKSGLPDANERFNWIVRITDENGYYVERISAQN